MLTTSVLPEMPASPRDRPASVMPADRPEARSASAIPSSSRSRMARVASGVTSRGCHTGAADRHHQVHTADHRRVERVADLDLVGGHHHDAVDHEPRLGEQFGDQRPAVVLLVAVRLPIVDDDDQCTPAEPSGCSMDVTVYPGGRRPARTLGLRSPGGHGRRGSLVGLAERDLHGLAVAGRVQVGQRHLVAGRPRADGGDQRVGAADHPVVDLGDHHAAGQAGGRGRAALDDLDDLGAVRRRVVADLHAQRGVRWPMPFAISSSAMRLA